MPKILVNVSDEQKVLWVGAAHDARLSLSEWIRRRCDGGLSAGDGEVGGSLRVPLGKSRRSAMEATATDISQGRESTPEGELKNRASAHAHSMSPAESPPARCSRAARHHINHSGRPCPECGWPTNQDWSVT